MKYFTATLLIAFLTSCGVQQNLSVSYKIKPRNDKS